MSDGARLCNQSGHAGVGGDGGGGGGAVPHGCHRRSRGPGSTSGSAWHATKGQGFPRHGENLAGRRRLRWRAEGAVTGGARGMTAGPAHAAHVPGCAAPVRSTAKTPCSSSCSSSPSNRREHACAPAPHARLPAAFPPSRLPAAFPPSRLPAAA
jgi:hypothetical protein